MVLFFFRDIKTARGKFKRAVLQFTPESWIKVDWYNNCALRRTLSIYGFVMVWLMAILPGVFSEQMIKLIFVLFFSRDIKTARGKFKRAVLQFTPESWIKVDWYNNCALRRTLSIYGFVMVWLSWVYLAICSLEASICIKFGRPQFPQLKLTMIVFWICFMKTEKVNFNGCLRECYLDSSHENLGALADEVQAHRKRLNISESDFD
ncbi:unnamed protein product [Gongylonema pulchrum]|uniref:Phosphatidylserine synthase n=1 Tax=Gongylonema pulchrum TaxID=637853 RepID=A0A3P7MFC3_9BILA|nr:unnamed protein product [Gongylonema pulchrum]